MIFIIRPVFCGERGIRTPEPVKVNGFQDRRIRPLCQLSNRFPVKGIAKVVKKYYPANFLEGNYYFSSSFAKNLY